MSWRSAPPSQYVDVHKAGMRVPLWVLLLVSVVCLALGATTGLTLRDDSVPADPRAKQVAAKRAKLVRQAGHELTAVTQLDAATGVNGAPSSFGLVVLGKEVRDVCATSKRGFLDKKWYKSGCGVRVSWYVAAKRGNASAVQDAAKARFAGRRIPTVKSFKWTKASGPLPRKLSGDVRAVHVRSGDDLAGLRSGAGIHFPEQDSIYHDKMTTFDLPATYATTGNGRKVVARISLSAEYSWN